MERKEDGKSDTNGCISPEFPDRGRRWSGCMSDHELRQKAPTLQSMQPKICTEYKGHTL